MIKRKILNCVFVHVVAVAIAAILMFFPQGRPFVRLIGVLLLLFVAKGFIDAVRMLRNYLTHQVILECEHVFTPVQNEVVFDVPESSAHVAIAISGPLKYLRGDVSCVLGDKRVAQFVLDGKSGAPRSGVGTLFRFLSIKSIHGDDAGRKMRICAVLETIAPSFVSNPKLTVTISIQTDRLIAA